MTMSNRNIAILALLLAIGILWIKGQERIVRRTLTNLPITYENLPANYRIPDFWTPRTRAVIQGPRNTIELVRSDLSSFRLDLSNLDEMTTDFSASIILSDDMFRTNLESANRDRIQVLEETIQPRQVVIQVLSRELGTPEPALPKAEDNELLVPIYRLEKEIPVTVPRQGQPAQGYVIESLQAQPPRIRMTGSYEALTQTERLQTRTLDVSGMMPPTTPIHLPLESANPAYDIRPVDEAVTGVTVTVNLVEEE